MDKVSDLELEVLYRALSKRIHPDTAAETERAKRTALMVRLNTANDRHDYQAMRQIALELEGKPAAPPTRPSAPVSGQSTTPAPPEHGATTPPEPAPRTAPEPFPQQQATQTPTMSKVQQHDWVYDSRGNPIRRKTSIEIERERAGGRPSTAPHHQPVDNTGLYTTSGRQIRPRTSVERFRESPQAEQICCQTYPDLCLHRSGKSCRQLAEEQTGRVFT